MPEGLRTRKADAHGQEKMDVPAPAGRVNLFFCTVLFSQALQGWDGAPPPSVSVPSLLSLLM